MLGSTAHTTTIWPHPLAAAVWPPAGPPTLSVAREAMAGFGQVQSRVIDPGGVSCLWLRERVG